MDFSFKHSLWQAQNLPNGFSLHNGILSGSHNVKGSFSVPVTVTTPFGSDTKNITINVRNRPGSEKFPILQDGIEIEQVTIPQLQSMVQDGTAQQKYNCTNTQIVIPMQSPYIFAAENTHRRDISYELQPQSFNAALNFCDFQNVTLQDDSIVPGLVLQFERTLWWNYTCFDYSDFQYTNCHNRWKFSNLRQWLNSSGLNWFTPAYPGDNISGWMNEEDDHSYYLADDSVGFLSLLPDDIQDILQPVKVITSAYWDEENENLPEPELIDNVDCDVSFDKVFIPSLSQMGFSNSFNSYVEMGLPNATEFTITAPSIEGSTWAFYSYVQNNNLWDNLYKYMLEETFIEDDFMSSGIRCKLMTRTPYTDDYRQIYVIYHNRYSNNKDAGLDDVAINAMTSPAPAFVIC